MRVLKVFTSIFGLVTLSDQERYEMDRKMVVDGVKAGKKCFHFAEELGSSDMEEYELGTGRYRREVKELKEHYLTRVWWYGVPFSAPILDVLVDLGEGYQFVLNEQKGTYEYRKVEGVNIDLPNIPNVNSSEKQMLDGAQKFIGFTC